VGAELPTPARPRGRGSKRAVLRAAEEEALALFPDRQLKIRSLVAQGQQVALEHFEAHGLLRPPRWGVTGRFLAGVAGQGQIGPG